MNSTLAPQVSDRGTRLFKCTVIGDPTWQRLRGEAFLLKRGPTVQRLLKAAKTN